MDGLAALLDGPRARGAFLLRILLDPPWAVRLQDEAPLSVTAVVRGHMYVRPDGEEPVRLEAGDVVVWVGSDHWTIADDPATDPQVVIHPGQVCRTLDGHVIVEEMSQWEPASLLSRFNHAPAGSGIDLPDDFAAVIAAALDIAARTRGAFDPAMGRLTDLHGFGATPLIELYLMVNSAKRILDNAGITATRFLTGSYVTSLDMAGISLTVSVLDAQAKALWDAPVHTAALRWGI